jgi:putative Mn2+ efflux pump MntP
MIVQRLACGDRPANRWRGGCDDLRVWKVVAFVLPLGLDSFAVAAALGTRQLSRGVRLRISGLFVVFEAGMPLVGLALGVPLARAVGSASSYVAAAILAGVGLWMLLHEDDDDPTGLLGRGWGAVLVGLSISLDELAIGFTLGLAGLPVVPVIVGIAVQALVASQLGLALGARVGGRFREAAERLAGLIFDRARGGGPVGAVGLLGRGASCEDGGAAHEQEHGYGDVGDEASGEDGRVVSGDGEGVPEVGDHDGPAGPPCPSSLVTQWSEDDDEEEDGERGFVEGVADFEGGDVVGGAGCSMLEIVEVLAGDGGECACVVCGYAGALVVEQV